MSKKRYKIDPDNPAKHLNKHSKIGVTPGSHRRTALRILLIIGCVFFLVLAGAGGGFLYLRAKGNKNLKTQMPEAEDESKQEGLHVTYNGKEYEYNDDIINFLCLGIDKDIPIEQKRETGSEGLADTILLVSVNVEEDTIKMLAVPRETIVPVKVLDTAGKLVGTENKQVTLQYAYGRTAEESGELMIEAVSNLLYKLPIQRYCAINFQALPVLNDAIGGVTLTSLETVYWWGGELHEGEEMHLLGQEALNYVRARDERVEESSMGRLERQKQYVSCYIEQAKEAVRGDLTLPVQLYKSLTEHMSTNVTLEDIAYLAPEMLDMTLNIEDISMVPGEVRQGEESEEYHVQTEALKEMVIQNFYKEVKDSRKKTAEDVEATEGTSTGDTSTEAISTEDTSTEDTAEE